MSTIFGICKIDFELEDDTIPEKYADEDFYDIAFRGNYGTIRWTNDIAKFLPDSLKVYPLDNTAQGIYSIGDIRKEINTE